MGKAKQSSDPQVPGSGAPKTKEALEREKLVLEIENLETKNRWEFYLPFFQLATVIGAMIGLAFGFWQFQSGQEKERITREREQTIRVQNQIRTDEEEILKFPQDKNQTLSRVSFLLGDLNKAFASQSSAPSASPSPSQDAASKESSSNEFQEYQRSFTESLVSLITRDLDVSNSPRDVGFAAITLAHWDDYTTYLKENPDILRVILVSYVNALRQFDKTNPSYLQELRYVADQFKYTEKYSKQEAEKHLYQHFKDIRNGFTGHLKLATDDPKPSVKVFAKQNVQAFELILCNDTIVEEVLGKDPERKPCEKPTVP